VQEQVLNWTSKGRQLALKRAFIASQLGVFSKPRDHVLSFDLHENSLQILIDMGISCL